MTFWLGEKPHLLETPSIPPIMTIDNKITEFGNLGDGTKPIEEILIWAQDAKRIDAIGFTRTTDSGERQTYEDSSSFMGRPADKIFRLQEGKAGPV